MEFMTAKYYSLKKTSYKDDAWVPYTEPDSLHPKKPDPGTDLISIQVVGTGESITFHKGIDVKGLMYENRCLDEPSYIKDMYESHKSSLEHTIDKETPKIHRNPDIPDWMVIQK